MKTLNTSDDINFSKRITINWKSFDWYYGTIRNEAIIHPFNNVDDFTCSVAGGPIGPHPNMRYRLCKDILGDEVQDLKVNGKSASLDQVIEIILKKSIDSFDRLIKYDYNAKNYMKERVLEAKHILEKNNVPEFQPEDLYTSKIYQRKREMAFISSFGTVPSDCVLTDYI